MRKILLLASVILMALGLFVSCDDGIENVGWDGKPDTSWYQEDKSEFELANAADLAGLAKLVNDGESFKGKSIKLGADINLEGLEWTPIGWTVVQTSDPKKPEIKGFSGTFDGAGYTISNLKINAPEKRYVGLFGVIQEGKITNVSIENVEIKGLSQVGAICGSSYTGNVSNCTVSGDIKIGGNYQTGGISGYGYATISGCKVLGNEGSYVKGIFKEKDLEGDAIGGIIGYYAENNTDLAECTVDNIHVEGTRKVGGVVGQIGYSSTAVPRKVTNCLFYGSVCSNADEKYRNDNKIYVGGILGEFTANGDGTEDQQKINIENCTVKPDTTISGFDSSSTGIIVGGSRVKTAIINEDGNDAKGVILKIN